MLLLPTSVNNITRDFNWLPKQKVLKLGKQKDTFKMFQK